ncbi:hypothetical protein FOZ63_028383 [Perkinsus olseni]|uniref:Uncharacterized protein n=1 Tax=Perkinsus olseni TaxID=32597 RepID=A0A7J6Q9F1_PEROL|nr:hypothetical protein FOZ63_028383 [Perkinsus olseni]
MFQQYFLGRSKTPEMPALLRCALFYLITLIGVDGAIARADEWPNGKFKRAIIIGIDGLGMTPSETGILDNEWDVLDLDPQGVPPVSGRGQLPPTIFKIAKKRNKNIRTALVHSWHWLGKLADENVDHTFHGGNEADHKTARDLVEQIKSLNPPHLSFIQFSWVDNAGHSSYWGSDKYYRFLKLVDGLVKNIHDALQEKMLSTETLIVITSDHGGYGSGHTLWMRPTAQVPVIFFSPSRSMKEPGKKGWDGWLDIKDVAPTVLGAMGIRNEYGRVQLQMGGQLVIPEQLEDREIAVPEGS